jgi:hypothetical protein
MWNEAAADVTSIEEKLGEDATPEQLIQLTQIRALLSISQQISNLNPANATYFGEDGVKLNGWGFRSPEQ